MKKIMLAISILSHLRGSATFPQESATMFAFMHAVREALVADDTKFDACFAVVRDIFEEKGPVDVDRVNFGTIKIKIDGSNSYGEWLNKIAFKEVPFKENPNLAFSNAQIILALVANARSQKEEKTSSSGLLHRLIRNAIESIRALSDQAVEICTKDEYLLMRYVRAGDFAGQYDLSEIPALSGEGESLQTYFERESKTDPVLLRVYRTLKASGATIVRRSDQKMQEAKNYGATTAGVMGVTFEEPKLKSSKGVHGSVSSAQKKRLGSASSNASKQSWRSYVTPRTMIAAGLLCVAVLIYKNYSSNVQQKAEESKVDVGNDLLIT